MHENNMTASDTVDGEENVDARLEREWADFIETFNKFYDIFSQTARNLNGRFRDHKDPGSLTETKNELKQFRQDIVIPHPMLLHKARAHYYAHRSDYLLRLISHRLGGEKVESSPAEKLRDLHKSVDIPGLEKKRILDLVRHENAHFASYVGSKELPAGADNPKMAITLGINFTDERGFFVDILGASTVLDATKLSPIALIDVALSPENPSEPDFEYSIEIAQRYGIDISGKLTQKGYPYPEKGIPTTLDKRLARLRYFIDRRRGKIR